MGIQHGVSKKDKPWQTHLWGLSKVFSQASNEKVDGGEAVQKKRKEADLDSEVENEMKKITIFIAYILIVLFALLPKISSIVYKI